MEICMGDRNVFPMKILLSNEILSDKVFCEPFDI